MPDPSHQSCEICDLLAKANYSIHIHTILLEAWARVREVPIVKSMHPDAKFLILNAIVAPFSTDEGDT
jgi:hypothetical protein